MQDVFVQQRARLLNKGSRNIYAINKGKQRKVPKRRFGACYFLTININ